MSEVPVKSGDEIYIRLPRGCEPARFFVNGRLALGVGLKMVEFRLGQETDWPAHLTLGLEIGDEVVRVDGRLFQSVGGLVVDPKKEKLRWAIIKGRFISEDDWEAEVHQKIKTGMVVQNERS